MDPSLSCLTRVVKIQDISGEPHNIRRIFSQCGEIHALHPYMSGNHAHYFIEFADPESGNRALALQHGVLGICAYEVANDYRLAHQYASMNLHICQNSTPGSCDISSAQGNITRGQIVPHLAPVSSFSNIEPPFRSGDAPRPFVDSHTYSFAVPSMAPYLTFSLEHRIQLSVGGQILTFDLDTLDEDPSVMISLLKTAASERAAWMIVAAHYRRRGYPHSALRVVNAMMSELTRRGVSPDEQKPAYIILAGCEIDLAKAGKIASTHPSEVARHYSNAQMWLQKVYGTNTVKHIQLQPGPPPSVVVSRVAGKRQSTQESHSSFPPHNNNSCKKWAGTGAGHQRRLEREIECLRDRQKNYLADLSETRIIKRRLEYSLAQERQVRRRLKYQVDLLSSTQDTTRKTKRVRTMDQPRQRQKREW